MKVNITENQLKQVVAESVKKVLKEFDDHRSNVSSIHNTTPSQAETNYKNTIARKNAVAPLSQRQAEANKASRITQSHYDRQNQYAREAQASVQRKNAEAADWKTRMRERYNNFTKFYGEVERYMTSKMKFLKRAPKMEKFGLSKNAIATLRSYYNTPENESTIRLMDKKIANLKRWGYDVA